MNRMESNNDGLILHLIPSILFILSNCLKTKERDRINKMNRMESNNDGLILR